MPASSAPRVLALALLFAAGASAARGGETPINGCTRSEAVRWFDASPAERTISFVCCEYTPPCVLIDAGQTVTFSGAFGGHPLRPGVVEGGTPSPQPGNPVPVVDDGSDPIPVLFPDAGDWGFYCNFHLGGGMFGAVYVALFADSFESGNLSEWSASSPLTAPPSS